MLLLDYNLETVEDYAAIWSRTFVPKEILDVALRVDQDIGAVCERAINLTLAADADWSKRSKFV